MFCVDCWLCWLAYHDVFRIWLMWRLLDSGQIVAKWPSPFLINKPKEKKVKGIMIMFVEKKKESHDDVCKVIIMSLLWFCLLVVLGWMNVSIRKWERERKECAPFSVLVVHLWESKESCREQKTESRKRRKKGDFFLCWYSLNQSCICVLALSFV